MVWGVNLGRCRGGGVTVVKIFPTESNKPIISWRHYLLKRAFLLIWRWRDNWILISDHMVQLSIIVRNHVQSLSVGKYYTSLLKSHTCNNYCYINKEISIHYYDANELNVFDISRIFSRICHGRSFFFFVIIYTMTSQRLSQIEAVNFRNMEFQIYFPNF